MNVDSDGMRYGSPRESWDFRHEAFFYRDDDSYAAGLVPFVTAGLDSAEPVFVAVPAPHIALLQRRLGEHATHVRFADMTAAGRNPSRIIPAIRAFVEQHAGRYIRFIGEPIWPGRSAAEVVEAIRHESLLNLAFADTPVHTVCPYDTRGLDARVLKDAMRTHPLLVEHGGVSTSGRYADPGEFTAAQHWPLPAPPADAPCIAFQDLVGVREAVRHAARAASMGAERTADVVLAANEVCTNSLRYGGGSGTVRLWRTDTELIFDVHDAGTIADPLVGRRHPVLHAVNGRGLFLANHLADLVEIRSTSGDTTTRLHFAV